MRNENVRINRRAGWIIRICPVCCERFKGRLNKRSGGRNVGLHSPKRESNSVTCSKKCSRIYLRVINYFSIMRKKRGKKLR